MWGKVSCLRKQHDVGLGLEPPTFRSEVQRANQYTTLPHPINYEFHYCSNLCSKAQISTATIYPYLFSVT